jgi:alanyl-tRNA synthetase
VARSKDLDINSVELAKAAGKILGGGGGGKNEFAKAGGSVKENLQKAVDKVKNMIKGSS